VEDHGKSLFRIPLGYNTQGDTEREKRERDRKEASTKEKEGEKKIRTEQGIQLKRENIETHIQEKT